MQIETDACFQGLSGVKVAVGKQKTEEFLFYFPLKTDTKEQKNVFSPSVQMQYNLLPIYTLLT